MQTVRLKLLTIIAEAILEPQLVQDVLRLGATGYSIGQVRGEGSRGVRASEWEGSNVRLEVIVPEAAAEAILVHVAERYFEHYAVIVWTMNVDVVRGEKYVP
jgi:nitrogen regulatory protein P-II 2